MKIGIMTFHRACNYGAVLQAYALQRYLNSCGHQSYFIDYDGLNKPPFFRRYIGRSIRNTLDKLNSGMTDIRMQMLFSSFARNNLVCGSHYDSIEALCSNPPEADAYICGSDQIWNPDIVAHEAYSAYWLDFGRPEVRRISYAASFGRDVFSAEESANIRRLAPAIDFVSVREPVAIDVIRQHGITNATKVPDPTILVDPAQYAGWLGLRRDGPDRYVFSYVLNGANRQICNDVINCVLAQSKLPHVRCNHSLIPTNWYLADIMSPEQWVASIAGAQFVITDSFHGTVFSILNHIPFISVLLDGGRNPKNVRIVNVLQMTGLLKRSLSAFSTDDVTNIRLDEIDWADVDSRLEWARSEGRAFLNQALLNSNDKLGMKGSEEA